MTLALLDPRAHLVIAHRGASAHAPENTLASFDLAVATGADALEFDVHLSADGHVMVIHDPSLDRTTDASGMVAALPLDRIRAADAGARLTRDGREFPFRGRGVRVPTIDEVLERHPRIPLLIEAKTVAVSEPLRRALERHGAADRCVIGSFFESALEPFRAPPWRVSASQPEVRRLLASAILPIALGDVRYQALDIPPDWRGIPLPMRRIVALARSRAIPVHVWVVDDRAVAARFWELGVNGITTNDPARIVAERDRMF